MPRYIVIELLPHTTDVEAAELATEIDEVFQLHYDTRIVETEKEL